LSVTCGRSVVFSMYSIQHYMIKFVSDLWQVCGFICVLYATLYDQVCQWLVAGLWFSLCTLYNIIWSSCQWLVSGLWFSLCTLYNIWSSLSVTCGRSVVFSVYSMLHYVIKFVSEMWPVSGFLQVYWLIGCHDITENIVERGVKHWKYCWRCCYTPITQ
jgi:hypothetical protein